MFYRLIIITLPCLLFFSATFRTKNNSMNYTTMILSCQYQCIITHYWILFSGVTEQLHLYCIKFLIKVVYTIMFVMCHKTVNAIVLSTIACYKLSYIKYLQFAWICREPANSAGSAQLEKVSQSIIHVHSHKLKILESDWSIEVTNLCNSPTGMCMYK